MNTEIRESHFSIDLPGDWLAADSDDPAAFVYRDTQVDQTLSVLLLGVRPVYAIADRLRLLEDYLHHRPQFEKGQRPALRQSPPMALETQNPYVGEWAGWDPETDRRLMHRVVLDGSLLADVVYEAAQPDEAAFNIQAAAVLDTLTVSEE